MVMPTTACARLLNFRYDLWSEPQFLNEPLFTSRLEFSEARFGKQHFSVESGREDAFVWPSIVRVGDEARKLAMQRLGTEGNSGISSPRRYLWDETPVVQDWRFSQMNSKTQREPLANCVSADEPDERRRGTTLYAAAG